MGGGDAGGRGGDEGSLMRAQQEGGGGEHGAESTDDRRSVSSLTTVLNAKRPRSGREYQVGGSVSIAWCMVHGYGIECWVGECPEGFCGTRWYLVPE